MKLSYLGSILTVFLGAGAIACGGSSTPPPASPEPQEVSSAVTTPEPAATTTPASGADDAAATSAPAPEKSAYTIEGVSLSEIDAQCLRGAIEKAGYGVAGPVEPKVCGAVEELQISLTRKGKPAGVLNLQRPAKSPASDCSPTSTKEAYETWKKDASDPKSTAALAYEEKADVLVGINMMMLKDGKAARALLDALVKKP